MKTLITILICLAGGIFLSAQDPADKEAKILYVSTRSGNAEIYLASATGKGALVNLSQHDGADLFPEYSPDGKRIAFTSDRDGGFNIFVMDADGKNVKQLTEEKVISRAPAWSPDGKKIAFTRHVDEAAPDIFVMDADGKNPVNLTNNPGYDADASWSPDSKRIVFASLRGDNQGFRLFVMEADGKDLKELTTEDNPFGFVYPAWSPDGKKIVYAHPAAEGLEIHVIDADGKNRKQLTKIGGQNSYAVWSRDGKKIAFHHRSEETTAIYIMDADGGNATAVVMNADLPIEGGRIAWQPK
jgi:Tol biopolymer transport system component